MPYHNEQAIQRLVDLSRRRDSASSSHWDQFHSTFEYKDGRLAGIQGFGGTASAFSPLHSLINRALQRPFRRMGTRFPGFGECEALAAGVASRQGRQYDLDVLRQTLTLSLLRDHIPEEAWKLPLVVIGDGFATMSSLLLAWRPEAKLVLVNLTKTLLVDAIYARRVHPEAKLCLVESAEEYQTALQNPEVRFIAVRAEDARIISQGPIGLAINIASMQEMNPSVVDDYFKTLRASMNETTYFYCCNRLDKTLPDGTRVRFFSYPWREEDAILFDELCPWHQKYYRPIPPFYRPYDGPIQHRLVRLKKA